MSTGTVFDIQRFCVDDGPGIRTTVFLKGCPLHCVWCHNAEGLSGKVQLYYSAEHCIGCQICQAVCPVQAHRFTDSGHTVDFSRCITCGACVDACPNESLRLAGKLMTAEEVLSEVVKDQPFFESSGGGMTLSGGEPLMQGEFAISLAKLAKERGLHVCIETSGFCNHETMKSIAQYVDLFLFDYKHSSPEAHKRYTGVENKIILENLEFLETLEKPVILRCPIIPDCNDTKEHYGAIAALANRMKNIIEIHIEPYHPFGVSKYTALGLTAMYNSQEMMPKDASEQAAETVRALSDKNVIIS